MRHYLHNVRAWLLGFRQLPSLQYKPGWTWWLYLPVYLLNVGTHVVLWGGAVTTWSRFSWENRRRYRLARAIDSLLDAVDHRHGQDSAPALWHTTPIPSRTARIVRATWAALTLLVVLRWLDA
jgi:hypothetical protein